MNGPRTSGQPPLLRDEGIRPELVFCLCAAVGTDTQVVTDALATEMRGVGYRPVSIRLSQLMSDLPGLQGLSSAGEEDLRIRHGMTAGNALRAHLNLNDAVGRLALIPITDVRIEANQNEYLPAEGCCFIISSLKRKEELDTLKILFGERLFLISVYESADVRADNLCKRISRSRNSADPDVHKEVAKELIDIDQKERGDPFGQRLEDVFPLADVFLHAGESLREGARRFIRLLFRSPFITPTIDELLLFQAKAAAQRSADLSRQVGAVIATSEGEILATGFNEVPRAGGGVSWENVSGSPRDYRDYRLGQDAAAAAKKEIAADALNALLKAGWIKDELSSKSPDELAALALFSSEKPLSSTAIASLLEFGRIVHAEMAAICDAAARGISIRGSTLYCTTFPCHMCARHIIAAGIARVVFIEPYPKSRTKRLYKRMVQVDYDQQSDDDAVRFEPFVGISPSRFLGLFSMVERKDPQGFAFNEHNVSAAPKNVTYGSETFGLEDEYLAPISQLHTNPVDLNARSGHVR